MENNESTRERKRIQRRLRQIISLMEKNDILFSNEGYQYYKSKELGLGNINLTPIVDRHIVEELRQIAIRLHDHEANIQANLFGIQFLCKLIDVDF